MRPECDVASASAPGAPAPRRTRRTAGLCPHTRFPEARALPRSHTLRPCTHQGAPRSVPPRAAQPLAPYGRCSHCLPGKLPAAVSPPWRAGTSRRSDHPSIRSQSQSSRMPIPPQATAGPPPVHRDRRRGTLPCALPQSHPTTPAPPLAPNEARRSPLAAVLAPLHRSRVYRDWQRPSAPQDLAGDASTPSKPENRTPRTHRPFPRPRPAGHGRRFAGFWPDQRRPTPKDSIASPQIIPGAHLRSNGIPVTL
jgi:hypothetical protein